MKALEERILKDGRVLPGNILKVGSFLNQQIDPDLLTEMGKEIARLFKKSGVTKIVTIESSGIAVAFAAAAQMHLPLILIRKHQAASNPGDVYRTIIHSFTHGNDYTAILPKAYLSEADTVLLIDDFLANGAALEGMIDLIVQSGARLAGCAVAIEKGFQGGGDGLRARGIRVEALALIDRMSPQAIYFRRNTTGVVSE